MAIPFNPFALLSFPFEVASGLQAAAAQRDAALANAREMEAMAGASEVNAMDALAQGAFASGRRRLAGALAQSAQAVAAGAAGVDATTGTAGALQASTGFLAGVDAEQESLNAMRRSMGLREDARGRRRQASQVRSNARAEYNNAVFSTITKASAGALGSIAGGALGGG